ncbi:MAG: hypothetical protein J7K00_03040 [Candidatus Diapherotrites archaeon]|nr:hypothetical protein [Candidatus Diapherotrites archaeon]
MNKQSAELNELLKKFFPNINGILEGLERENWSQESALSAVSSMLSNGPVQELFQFKSRVFPMYVENMDPEWFGMLTAVIVAEDIETFYILGALMEFLKKIDSGALSTKDELMHEFFAITKELTKNREMSRFEEISVVVCCSTEEELEAVTTQLRANKLWQNAINYFDKEIYPKVKAILNLEKPVFGRTSAEFLVTNNQDDFLAKCKDKPVVIMPKLRNENQPDYEQLIEKLLENGCKITAPTWLVTSPNNTLLERRIKAVKELSKQRDWKTELVLHTGGMGFFPDTNLEEIQSTLRINVERQGVLEMAQDIADITGGIIIVTETT